MMRNQKGITLIALVITIIVLLILAGVSIAMLTGENGILTKSKEATKASSEAEKMEAVKLALAEIVANKLSDVTEDASKDVYTTITAAHIQAIVTRDNSNAGTLALSDVTDAEGDVTSVTFVNGEKTYTIDATSAKIVDTNANS